MNKLIARVALATALVVGSAFMAVPANASTITWTLSGVTFDDGGTASGSFTIDTSTGQLTTFDIITTSTSLFPAFEYNNSSATQNVFDLSSFVIASNANQFHLLSMFFADPLSSPGTDLLQLIGPCPPGSCESDYPFTLNARLITAGEAIVSSAPLPAALPLFASGLGGMGLFGWWRKRKDKLKSAVALAAA